MAIVVSFVLGCAKDGNPPAREPTSSDESPETDALGCREIVRHIATIDADAPAATPLGEENIRRMEAYCEKRAWSVDARRCLREASDQDGLAGCERAERLRRGDDLGGPDCEPVVGHLRQVLGPLGHEDAGPYFDRSALMRFCSVRSRTYKECVLRAAAPADYAKCAADETPPP